MSNVLYIKRREGVILIYTDNKDFYPTPKALFNRLLGDNIRWLGGKILEPSAGEQERNEEARRWVAKEFGDIGEVRLLKV